MLANVGFVYASVEVHKLVKVVASYMVDRRGGELGFMDKEQKIRHFRLKLCLSTVVESLCTHTPWKCLRCGSEPRVAI